MKPKKDILVSAVAINPRNIFKFLRHAIDLQKETLGIVKSLMAENDHSKLTRELEDVELFTYRLGDQIIKAQGKDQE